MVTDVLTRHTSTRSALAPAGPSPRSAIGWLVGAVVMFAPSLVASDLGALHHDLYLLIYFTVALGYLGRFAIKCGVAWRRLLRSDDPERAGGALGQLLAAGWPVLVAAVLVFIRDRWLPPLRGPTHSS